ncbi:MAG: hypothetical protein H7067_19585 [Burkholderiales bacterium]|nr:hypothetical protein [Opitutaceae bacterium]
MRPRFPRSTVLALTALVLLSAPVSALAAEAKIVRVWPEYRAAESFVRIGEYFGGVESAPETIVRSQPDSRDGYYFLTRFKTPEALPGSILVLEYYVPGDELARVQFFPVDLEKGSRAILAGLTGADWTDAKAAPTAWRLRLLGPSGAELARQQSFLWSLPPAETTANASYPASAPASTEPVAPAATPAG